MGHILQFVAAFPFVIWYLKIMSVSEVCFCLWFCLVTLECLLVCAVSVSVLLSGFISAHDFYLVSFKQCICLVVIFFCLGWADSVVVAGNSTIEEYLEFYVFYCLLLTFICISWCCYCFWKTKSIREDINFLSGLCKQVVGPFKIWPCEVPNAFLQEWRAGNSSNRSRSRPRYGFGAHGNVFTFYYSIMVVEVVGNRNFCNLWL